MAFLFDKDTCVYFPFPSEVEPQAQGNAKKIRFNWVPQIKKVLNKKAYQHCRETSIQ